MELHNKLRLSVNGQPRLYINTDEFDRKVCVTYSGQGVIVVQFFVTDAIERIEISKEQPSGIAVFIYSVGKGNCNGKPS